MAYQTHPSKSFFVPSLKVDIWLEEHAMRDPQFYAQNKLLQKMDLVRIRAESVHKQIKNLNLPSPAVEVEEEFELIKGILDKIDDELHEYFSKQYLEIFHA